MLPVNCYIILGVLLNVAVSVLFYLFTGFPLILTPCIWYTPLSLFLLLMFPEAQVMLMMVLPLKAKWIALAEALIYVYDFAMGSIFTKAEIFVCLIHMCIFFLWMVLAGETGYRQKRRQQEFKKKMRPAAAVKTVIAARCAAVRTRTAPGWNSATAPSARGALNIVWIICIPTSM